MLIELKNVSYSYTSRAFDMKVKAVDNFNLNINEGEFIAILGTNGSGKSTVAKMLNGILIPDEGEVRVLGMSTKDEKNLIEIRRNVGFVFQNPDNQIIATIVEEDVAFGPENLGMETKEIRRRVDEALKTVGLEDYKKHAPHLLSGGQKQRLAIAGILAINPPIIVFDEPTAMLDPKGRDEVLSTIKRLNKEENKTVVYITHFMNEVTDADRIIVMKDAEMIYDAKPRELFSKVDEMKSIGLAVPQVTELAHLLKKDGFNIDSCVLNIDELVDKL